jgi:cytochrome c5
MRKTTAVSLAAAATFAAWMLTSIGAAQSPPAPTTAAPANGPAPPVEFTKEFLGDAKNVQQGREVWQTRCEFCHGKMAYPGKAP